MLNRSASLVLSTSVLKAEPGKLNIKRHSPIYSTLVVMKNVRGLYVLGYNGFPIALV